MSEPRVGTGGSQPDTGAPPIGDDVEQQIGEILSGERQFLPTPAPRARSAGLGAVIPYQPSQAFSDETGISPEQYDVFRGYLAKRESNSYAQAPISTGSATTPTVMGRYQMGPNEIATASRNLGIPTPSTGEFLGDPQLQEQLFENYTLGHHRTLMNNPMYANGDANTRMALLAGAHLGGPGGVSAWQNGQNRSDKFGTSVGNYINGMYSAVADGSALPQPGTPGFQLVSGPGSGSGSTPTRTPPPQPISATDAENQINEITSGDRLFGPKPGAMPLTPQDVINNGIGVFTPMSQADLGLPQGAQKVDIQKAQQRAADGRAVNMPDIGAENAVAAYNNGYDTYVLPDGSLTQRISPGNPQTDPRWGAYKTVLEDATKATQKLTDVLVYDPETQQQVRVQMPESLAIFGAQRSPYWRVVTGQPAPGQAAPGGPGQPPPGAAPPPGTAPPSGATLPPGAAPPSGAGGAGGAGPAAGPPPGAAPPAVPPLLHQLQVSRPQNGGPAVIAPPPAPPPLQGGVIGTPVYPPGYAEGINKNIQDDRDQITQLGRDAAKAQDVLTRVTSIQGSLQNVLTGTSEHTRSWIGDHVLRPLGVPDDKIQAWTGVNPADKHYLDKALLQLVLDQMPTAGGAQVMGRISDAFPSLEETPAPAIKMLLNGMAQAAQRTLDMRKQAVQFRGQSEANYRDSYGRSGYTPLADFLTQFDEENPATAYYHAAQAMTPEFSNEAFVGAPDGSAARDQILGLIPNGSAFRVPEMPAGQAKTMRR